CFLATQARISLMVMILPRGTRFMMASTSMGAGMATVPLPQRVDILPVIGTTFGKSLLSLSFSCQDFRFAMFRSPRIEVLCRSNDDQCRIVEGRFEIRQVDQTPRRDVRRR